MTMPLPTGLKLPRYVPTYEAVDALYEPILEDARELQEYAAKRVVELEAELAKVNYELVRMRPCCRLPDPCVHYHSTTALVAGEAGLMRGPAAPAAHHGGGDRALPRDICQDR